MDNPYSYQDSLHLLNNSEWNKLSLENRAAVMQSVENETARREGRPPCNVSLFSEPPNAKGMINAGKYHPDNGSIGVNAYHLQGNPAGCLNTVLHEGRHDYQEKAVKGEIYHHDKAELKAWRENMKPGHYIDGKKNPRAYYRQPIEADAHKYAEITTGQILAEQKIQNNTNKGISSFAAKSVVPGDPAASANKGIQSFRDRVNRAEIGSASNAPNTAKSESSGRSSGSGGQNR